MSLKPSTVGLPAATMVRGRYAQCGIGSRKVIAVGPTKIDTAVEPRVSGGENEYIHIVSYWEWLVADVLRRRIPRSLCGVALIEDPDRRPTQSTDPVCPRCEELDAR
ncbi:Uncharacterised protein [Mycobacteroides abscessus subsp. abscessus]|nr:Uncharacterised protein [Mycobacteroides abscessus subsp. abscessus]